MMRITFRQATILLTSLVALAYLGYRALFTLNLSTPYATFASLFLFAGELYGVVNMLLYFVQVWDVSEPPERPVLPDRTVDVFVPTYNEDPDLLRLTLRACVGMDYPHRTYLCDDGGTDARVNDSEKGPVARERALKLKAICEELGVIYMTRPKNEHAKAGNLNHAFERTDGEFLIIFDADHVPEPHFITRLIGYFADERLAFVQTPHAFYNFDSFQARLDHRKRKYWEEGQLFYHVIQPGRNRAGCPIFAGSAALFRRSALKEVGYIATETITEDMHTGLRMHARGWKSLGISERMVAGQAAQDVTTFHSQRLRWGEGNLSVIFHDNPLTMRGLTLGQRLCYAATILNWASGLFKLAIYLTPLLMLFTGVPPVNRFTWTLGVLMGLYMGMCILGTKVAGNGYGSFWYSELFTMASFWTQIRGTMRALFWRKFQVFVVTSKRGRQSNSIWPFIRPQTYLMIFSALAILWAWSRLALGVSDDPYKPMLATFWAGLHMLLAYLVVRRAFWPDDRRYATRHTVYLAVTYRGPGPAGGSARRRGLGFTADLNDQGMTLVAYEAMQAGDTVRLTLHVPGGTLECEAVVKSVRPLTREGPTGTAGFRHGLQFQNRSVELIDALNLVCLHYAVPRLYHFYEIEGHIPLPRKVINWAARHWLGRRSAERRRYRLPLLMFPAGEPDRGNYCVTEDVSRLSMAVLLTSPLEPGAEIRYSMATPLGEVSGTGRVLRRSRRDVASRPFYLTVVEFDRFDEEGRGRVNDLFGAGVARRLDPLLEPVKAPIRVPMNRPLAIGAAAAVVLLTTEFGVFRLLYRDDFFLRQVATSEQALTADDLARLDRVYRDTARETWPSTDRLVLLGRALAKADRVNELAEVARRLAPRDPGNLDLQLAVAHADDQREDFDQAEAEFRALLAAQERGELPASRREEILAGLARTAAHAGDAAAAAARYAELVVAYPDRANYRHEYAGVLLSARRYREAAAVYEDGRPDHEGRVMLVLIHTAAKDWAAAEREARALLVERPDDAAAQGLLADVLTARGDFRQAKAVYERLLRSGGDDLRIGVQLAQSSLWAHDYDEALERFQAVFDRVTDFNQLLRLYPTLPRGYVNAAASAGRVGDAHRTTCGRLADRAISDRSNDPVYLARLGWVLQRLGEVERSATLLDQAVALDPADQGLRMQLAGALVSAGRADEALRLLGQGATTPEGRLLLADVYLAAKKLDAAEKECRAVLADDPARREARLKLADVLSWKGEYAASRQLFEGLLKDYPDDPTLPVRLGEIALWSGDFAGAVSRFESLLAADFDRPTLWYDYVDAAASAPSLNTEQVRLAEAVADRVLAGDHRAARAAEDARKRGRTLNELALRTRLAWVLLSRAKDPARAGAVLDQVRDTDTAPAPARRELAGVLAAAGRYAQALKLYESLGPELKDRLPVARIHAALKQFGKAAEQCREVIKHAPLDRDARRLLADVLSWDGKWAESLALFDALLQATTDDSELLRRRAEVTLWSGDAAGALPRFTAMLDRDPDRPELWRGFIGAAARVGRLSEAQVRLAARVATRPEVAELADPDFLVQTAGLLRQTLKDTAGADALLARAFSLRPKEAGALARLSWELHRAGDKANATLVLEEALALQPKEPAALRDLAGTLTATGRFKEAAAIYKELSPAAPTDAGLRARLAEVTLWAGDPGGALTQLSALLEENWRQASLWRPFADAAAAAPSLTAAQARLAVRLAGEAVPEGTPDEQTLYRSRLGWALHREAARMNDAALRGQADKLLDQVASRKPVDLQARAEAAGVLAAAGRAKAALPWLEELARANPRDAALQRRLGEAALAAGAYGEALTLLGRLLEEDFDRPGLWPGFVDAAAAVKKGTLTPAQLAVALRLAAGELPASAPDPTLYLCRLSWVLTREGRVAEAGTLVNRALAADPKTPEARRELAGVLTAAGRHKDALNRLEELLALHPDDEELRGQVAQAALWAGDRRGALDRLTKLLSARFELSRFWQAFVDAAAPANQGELTPAQVELAARIAGRPVPASVADPAEYLSRLGWVLQREGREALAGPLLDRAAARPPASAAARRELGGVLTAAGKYREALRMFEGLELTPDDRLALVVLYSAARQFDLAEKECLLVLQARPNDVVGRRRLAEVTLWGGRAARALVLFEELLAAELDQPALWPGFAESAAKAPALTEAQARLVVRIAGRPAAEGTQDAVFAARLGLLLYRDAEGREVLPVVAATAIGLLDPPPAPFAAAGVVRSFRGRQERSAAWLDRAYRLRPRDAVGLAHLAWALYQAGREAQAAVALDEAIAVDPREPAARREVGDALVATGRLREALSWFEALAAARPHDAELRTRLAEVTVWAGEYAKGLARVDALLREDFNRPGLWRPFVDAAAGVTELTEGQAETARRLAAQTLPADWDTAGRVLFCSRLAWALLRDGPRLGAASLTEAAQRLLDVAQRLEPREPAVRRELAGVLTAARRFADARVLYEAIDRDTPGDPDARVWVARLTLWEGRPAEALAMFEGLIRTNPRRSELWRWYAEAAVRVTRLTDSQRDLLLRLADEPVDGVPDAAVFQAALGAVLGREGRSLGDDRLRRNGDALLDRAVARLGTTDSDRLTVAGFLAASGRPGAARAALQGIKTDDPSVRALLVDLYSADRDFDAAEREARELARARPDDWDTRFKLASVLGWNKKYAESAALYDRLARERPDDPRLPLRQAEVSLWAGRFDDALARYMVLVEKGICDQEVLSGFADAAASARELNAQHRKAALAVYASYRAQPPADAVSLSRLAWVLTRVKESTAATDLLRRAVALDPRSRELRRRLAQALSAAGYYAEAEAQYQELLRTAPRAAAPGG